MKVQRGLFWGALAALLSATPVTLGEDGVAPAGPSAADVRALLKRLEAAEKRIKELENQIKPSKKEKKKETGYSAGATLGVGEANFEDKKDEKKEDKSKSLADRIKSLEDEAKKSDKTIGEIEDEVSGLSDYFKWSSGITNFRLNGRIHLDYVHFFGDSGDAGAISRVRAGEGDPENRLVFRRLRLTQRGDIADNVDWKLDIEFAGIAAQTRDAYFSHQESSVDEWHVSGR